MSSLQILFHNQVPWSMILHRLDQWKEEDVIDYAPEGFLNLLRTSSQIKNKERFDMLIDIRKSDLESFQKRVIERNHFWNEYGVYVIRYYDSEFIEYCWCNGLILDLEKTDHEETILSKIIASKNVEALQLWHSRGAKFTPLVYEKALLHFSYDCIHYLLCHGMPITYPGILAKAIAERCDANEIDALCTMGVVIDERACRMFLCHYSKALLIVLLDHGMDIHFEYRGNSLMFSVIMYDPSLKTLEMLLQRGAQVSDFVLGMLMHQEHHEAIVKLIEYQRVPLTLGIPIHFHLKHSRILHPNEQDDEMMDFDSDDDEEVLQTVLTPLGLCMLFYNVQGVALCLGSFPINDFEKKLLVLRYHRDIIKLFIPRLVNDLETSVSDETVLDYAIRTHDYETCELLMKAGAKIHSEALFVNYNMKITRLALEHAQEIATNDDINTMSPLKKAIESHDKDLLGMFFDRKIVFDRNTLSYVYWLKSIHRCPDMVLGYLHSYTLKEAIEQNLFDYASYRIKCGDQAKQEWLLEATLCEFQLQKMEFLVHVCHLDVHQVLDRTILFDYFHLEDTTLLHVALRMYPTLGIQMIQFLHTCGLDWQAKRTDGLTAYHILQNMDDGPLIMQRIRNHTESPYRTHTPLKEPLVYYLFVLEHEYYRLSNHRARHFIAKNLKRISWDHIDSMLYLYHRWKPMYLYRLMHCVFTMAYVFQRLDLIPVFEELILLWDDPLLGYCFYESFLGTIHIKFIHNVLNEHNVRMNKLYRIAAMEKQPHLITNRDDWTYVAALFFKNYEEIAKHPRKELSIDSLSTILCNRFTISKHEWVRWLNLLVFDPVKWMEYMLSDSQAYDCVIVEVLIEYFHVDVNFCALDTCPLHQALVHLMVDHFKWLVMQGASTEVRVRDNKNGASALSECISKNSEFEHMLSTMKKIKT